MIGSYSSILDAIREMLLAIPLPRGPLHVSPELNSLICDCTLLHTLTGQAQSSCLTSCGLTRHQAIIPICNQSGSRGYLLCDQLFS